MNKNSQVITHALHRDAETTRGKVSLKANRANDPTPLLSDTRQTLGVHHSLTHPRFRRGDYVISAAEALDTTGIPIEVMAKQVIDTERHETGWMVGVERCEGRYEHEAEYILLEMVEDWNPNCNNGTFFWTKGVARS